MLKERSGSTIEEVDALRLHQLIDLETLVNVRLIKIDVEGAEWFVMKRNKRASEAFFAVDGMVG